jgi:hypothetical protein
MPSTSIPTLVVNIIIWGGIFYGVYRGFLWYKKKELELMFKGRDTKTMEVEKK